MPVILVPGMGPKVASPSGGGGGQVELGGSNNGPRQAPGGWMKVHWPVMSGWDASFAACLVSLGGT
jgi:hypothetical protein